MASEREEDIRVRFLFPRGKRARGPRFLDSQGRGAGSSLGL